MNVIWTPCSNQLDYMHTRCLYFSEEKNLTEVKYGLKVNCSVDCLRSKVHVMRVLLAISHEKNLTKFKDGVVVKL